MFDMYSLIEAENLKKPNNFDFSLKNKNKNLDVICITFVSITSTKPLISLWDLIFISSYLGSYDIRCNLHQGHM